MMLSLSVSLKRVDDYLPFDDIEKKESIWCPLFQIGLRARAGR